MKEAQPAGPAARAQSSGLAKKTWLMHVHDGCLYMDGRPEETNISSEPFNENDRLGVLLDLDEGSLRFFKNGVEYGLLKPLDLHIWAKQDLLSCERARKTKDFVAPKAPCKCERKRSVE